MKFTYGFRTKTIKSKEYVYFWKYTGTGHKTEAYMGPAGKPATEKRALQTEIEYLEGLQNELSLRLQALREKLERL
jgi:hypothetical protein